MIKKHPLIIFLLFTMLQTEYSESRTPYKKNEQEIAISQALTLTRNGRYDDSEAILRSILKKERNNASAHDGLSRLYEAQDDLTNAYYHSLAACSLEPLNPYFIGQMGTVLIKSKKYDDAIETLQKAVRIKGTDSDKYYKLLSFCHQMKSNFSAAAEAELGRLWTRPWDDTIYVDASKLYEKAGDISNAKLMRRMAGNAWDEYAYLTSAELVDQAWTAFKNRKYDVAAELFLKISKFDEDDAKPAHMAGVAFLKAKNRLKAKACFYEALKRDPLEPSTHLELGTIYFDENRFSEALTHFNRCLKLDKQNIKAWMYTALIHEKNNDLGKAVIAWLNASSSSEKETDRKKYLNKAGKATVKLASSTPQEARKLAPKIIPLLDKTDPSWLILKKFMDK